MTKKFIPKKILWALTCEQALSLPRSLLPPPLPPPLSLFTGYVGFLCYIRIRPEPKRTMAVRAVGNLSIDSTVFFLCDMQEWFRSKIVYFPEILHVAKRMVCNFTKRLIRGGGVNTT